MTKKLIKFLVMTKKPLVIFSFN